MQQDCLTTFLGIQAFLYVSINGTAPTDWGTCTETPGVDPYQVISRARTRLSQVASTTRQ